MNPLRTISLATALLIATAACGGSSGNDSPGSSTIAPPDTTVPGASTVDSTDPLPSTIDGDTVDSSAPSGLQARLLTQSDLGSGWIATYSQPGDEVGSFGGARTGAVSAFAIDPATGRVYVNTMATVKDAVLAGTLDPALITITRAIRSEGYAGETDRALFTGNLVNYTLTYLNDGWVQVVDNVAGRDGTDLVRNVEQLVFADQTITVAQPSAPTPVIASATPTSVTLNWTVPGRTGGSAISGYTANLYATAKSLGFDIDYKRLLREFPAQREQTEHGEQIGRAHV